GQHTIARTDPSAECNQLTVFIDKTSADKAVGEAHEKAASAAGSTTAPAFGPVIERARASAADEAAWGEPVEGVSVRLRADKKRWTTNETPTFTLDVRNQRQRQLGTFHGQDLG